MSRNKRQIKSIFHPAILGLMLLGILLNVTLSALVGSTGLPFYFDTVGTITVTALGGPVPGLFTAFITNAINFLRDGESVFYAPLNMMIALLSAFYFGEYSIYKKNRHEKNKNKREGLVADLVLFILIIALVGGGIGGEITWYLYHSPSDSPLVVTISDWLHSNLGIGTWGCHMISSYLMDVIDKTVSVLISLLIIRLTPAKLKEILRLYLWRQKPLTYQEEKTAKIMRKGKFSIGTRITLIVVLSTVLMTVIVSAFSIVSYRQNMLEMLSDDARQVSYLAAQVIDPEQVDDFIENGYENPEYESTKEKLELIKDSAPNISFLYVYRITKDGCVVVFDLDTTLSDGSFVEGDAPGKKVALEAAMVPYLDELISGEQPLTEFMKDEYGTFITCYYPVYNEAGSCICYAISNIEFSVVVNYMSRFFGRVLLLFTGFFILIITISVLTTKYNIVMPITGMTLYADELVNDKNEISDESLGKIESLDIHTKDEVEMLYHSLNKLTGDAVAQLKDIETKSEAISKMQTGLIITMADMVESRDSDTGAHVLKTSAYVRIILQGLKRNGYYAEKITDRYMRDVEMSAPLHDVGKINIPDNILNKPGRLTEEEFAIMKTHTTAGKQIIEKAINTMEGDNYLKEAKNMAAYHHERWDGKGYPEGLHGEVIPLSARVMAVADVFDALASPRIYKPAFPLEEAIRIIEEGSGTQFDPKCVEVFVESLPEVKKVLSKYQETK